MPEPSSETLPFDAAADGTPNAAQIRPDAEPGPAILRGLTLVATPIGNLGDISLRAIAALQSAELVLCEDTRTTARLFAAHSISSRSEALHEHNEDARIPGLLDRLRQGAAIALVSDAGTPLMSDPGYRLVRAALVADLPVHAVPGANAALTALLLSGLPPHPYLFLGFASARTVARQASYAKLRAAERAGLAATLIWHEAPHRLAEALADLAACFGERPAAVARELTKRYEEVRRATLPTLAAHYATHEARGEVTVLVGPAPEEVTDAAALDDALRGALERMTVRDAAAAVAAASGLPRKTVYARALDLAKRL
jgi:16S rRNA (cytidine1402-2'-O)-methyltransferase